ncbi:MAG TPA: hypothetical protein VHM24_05900 [Gemmatimonadaceae bacterium]|nr:hypothetical protein [Gemmatimonadaceae bacterium]
MADARSHHSRITAYPQPGREINIRQLTWPALLSAAVIGFAGRVSSVVDSRDFAAPPGVSIELPALYIATSPLSRLLDTLTLLSNPQSVALFVTVAAIVTASLAARRNRSTRPQWLRIVAGLISVILSIAALEAIVVFAPRPMARLVVSDPDVVVVDFHTHTRASGDANQRFTAEDRRRWHRDGGFNIGYLSDHVRFAGAAEAERTNPVRAGDGVSELSAVEGRYHKIMSTIMLGLTAADTALLDRKGQLLPGVPASGRTPVTIIALPNRNLDSVTAESLDSLPHFAGLELVDAAPRGLSQLDREELKIRRLAAALRLMLVSSSNNHGYGRAVAAWNLIRIPGWRALPPDSVGRLIEQPFRERSLNAVTIVKRLRPRNHGVAIVWTLPVALWQMIGSLAAAERIAWLVWIWGLWGAMRILRSGTVPPRIKPPPSHN